MGRILAIILLGVLSFSTGASADTAKFLKSSRIETIATPKTVQSTTPKVAAVVQPPVAPQTPQPQTPAPEPVATPAPVYIATTYSGGCDQWRGLVSQYGWDVNVMLAIMQAESGCNPGSVSGIDNDGLRDYGLFQIHGEAIMDPAQNIARAYGKFTSQGLHAWSTYTNGAYLRYMQ